MVQWVNVFNEWSESDLSDFWLSEMLRNQNGWRGHDGNQEGFFYRKEAKSSGPHRLDIELWHDKHVVGCIELKNPRTDFKNSGDLRVWIKQASKYSVTRCEYHHGKIVSPIGILTNGRHAVIFNGSLPHDEVLNYHHLLDLDRKQDRDQFLKILDSRNWPNGVSNFPYAEIKFQETRKSKIISGDQYLAKDILSLFRKIEKSTRSHEKAFKATTALFMLAMLRECGLFPNDKIKELAKANTQKSWRQVIHGIERILHSDLTSLHDVYCDGIWKDYYEDTSWFRGNLSTFPATGLGKAYEKLLHVVSENTNTTSYYTPSELISECIEKIQPKSNQVFLDPTCGSGSFLASILEHVISAENLTKDDVRNYIEKQVFGVDKDRFACEIAKCVLVSIYAKSIPYKRESANSFQAPRTNIINENFFKWQTDKKFTFVVGNPPWGNIDSELENGIRPLVVKYKSYQERTDVCCLVVEKSVTLLAPEGLYAFVCKHELLDGKAHSAHRREIWLNNGANVLDYGRKHWFSNAARTILIFGEKEKKVEEWACLEKHVTTKKKIPDYSGTLFGELFSIHEGHISGRDPLYRFLGHQFPDNPQSKMEIEDHCILPFTIRFSHRTFFMEKNARFSDEIRRYAEKTKIEIRYKKSKLLNIPTSQNIEMTIYSHVLNRSDCVQTGKPYEGWSRVFSNWDHYIVMPTYVRGSQIRAAYASNAMVPTSTTIYAYPKDKNFDTLIYALAFLNTGFAFEIVTNHPEIRQADAGKTAIKPTSLGQVRIPECKNDVLKRLIIKIGKMMISQNRFSESVTLAASNILDLIFRGLAYGPKESDLTKQADALLKHLERKKPSLRLCPPCRRYLKPPNERRYMGVLEANQKPKRSQPT